LCEGVVCEDDGNECTDGVCDPATGMCEHVTVEDDTACDFGGLPGLCQAGVCEDAMLCEGVVCEDDDNQCTNDVCDPATGTCGHVTVEDDTACDFGGSPGLCKAGVCVDAMLCEGVMCDDDNECTSDACEPATGECNHTPIEDGTGCTDGICRAGVCGPLCSVANVCHCSEAGIRAAIEGGGYYPYTFDCNGPTTVVTAAQIDIDNDVILDGENNLTVDGNGTHRVFSVASYVTTELREMTITRGAASGDGGGIYNDGTLALTGATVSSNRSGADGGGIWNEGTLTLTECTVTGNTAAASGGGIENRSGIVELNRSTVSSNAAMAGGGGAIESGGGGAQLLLINTTVSGNVPTAGRGAIENDAWAVVFSSTLQQLPVGNERYVLAGSGWVEFRNTILHGECAGWSVDSYGGNIESPGDTCGLWAWEDQPLVPEVELNLGPLEKNGGPTLTHLPGQGSVAIDQIELWACMDANWEPLETDQRGVGRPRGDLCDVGSVEGDSHCGGVDCDDQNQCTRDSCDPTDGSCSYEPVPEYMYCELGNGGTGGMGGAGPIGGAGGIGGYVPGVCYQGECIPDLCWGNPCDDGNPCTSDYCDRPEGSCSYEPVPDEWQMYCELGGGGSGGSGGFGGNGGPGGTGGAGGTGGSVPGVCVQGECIENPCWGNPCDDGNDCRWDYCSFPDGSCSYEDRPDGAACVNNTGQCLDGACELYAVCGAERSIPPTAITDSGILYCESTLPVQIVVTMAATPQSAIQEGPIDFETQFEVGVTAETVNDLLQLGVSNFRIESLSATIDATMGDSNPMPALVSESPVPCIGILEWDTAHSTVTPTVNATWTLDVGSVLELTALQFEETLTAFGIPITLTTEGPEATCVWETSPPTLSFVTDG